MNTISSYCWMFFPLGVGPGLPRWEDGNDVFVKRTGSTSCPGALKLCAFKSQRLAVETVIDVERDVCSSWFEKIKLSTMDKNGRIQSYTSLFFYFHVFFLEVVALLQLDNALDLQGTNEVRSKIQQVCPDFLESLTAFIPLENQKGKNFLGPSVPFIHHSLLVLFPPNSIPRW